MRVGLRGSILFALFIVTGCDHSEPAPSGAAPAPAPAPAPATLPAVTGTGVVRGAVTLTGPAPSMPELARGVDPVCAKDPMRDEEVVVGKNGGLKNVIVRIVGAPATAPPTTSVVLDQQKCMYSPRVVALVAGQTLKVKNSDETLHNIHTFKGASTVFNIAQIPGSLPIQKQFNENGLLLKVHCDIHQWMLGYAWVQNNSLFAVTGDDGKFEIKGLPDGTWDIEAWHERYGTQKGKITVAHDKPAEWSTSFASAPQKG